MSDENKKKVEEPDFEKLARTTAPSKFNKIVTIILVAICVVLAAFIIVRMMTTSDDNAMAVQATADTGAISAVNVSAEPATIKEFSRISRMNGEIMRSGDSIAVYPDIAASGTVTEITVSRGDAISAGDIVAYVDPSRPGASYKISPVVSKVNGIVNDIPVAIGQTVTASQPIVTVAGNTDLVVEASIPEKFLGTIAEGMTAEMESVAYPGRIYTGILTYIAPTVDSTTRSSDIEIQLTGDTAGLKEGMYIRLNLETEHINNALTVPSSALDTYLGDDIVYIADGDTARRTIVTTGSTNGVDTVITSGLSEGDMVITAGNVTDGTAISVVNQEN